MKLHLLILLASLTVSTIANAQQRLSLDGAARITQIAINMTDEKIKAFEAEGKSRCQYMINPDQFGGGSTDLFPTTGRNAQFAQALAQIKCIRSICKSLPGAVDKEAQRLSQDEQQFLEIARAHKYTEEEIKLGLENIRSGNRGSMLACETSTNMAVAAQTFCTATPMECRGK